MQCELLFFSQSKCVLLSRLPWRADKPKHCKKYNILGYHGKTWIDKLSLEIQQNEPNVLNKVLDRSYCENKYKRWLRVRKLKSHDNSSLQIPWIKKLPVLHCTSWPPIKTLQTRPFQWRKKKKSYGEQENLKAKTTNFEKRECSKEDTELLY